MKTDIDRPGSQCWHCESTKHDTADCPSRRRDVQTEQTREQIGNSGAASSHQALFYNLISPYTIRRLAERKTVGGKKYGLVQWRIGINDGEYVADRFNHLFNHLLEFMEHGNKKDDNLGAMLWALDCLIEVERLCPEALSLVVGMCNVYGQEAKEMTEIMHK